MSDTAPAKCSGPRDFVVSHPTSAAASGGGLGSSGGGGGPQGRGAGDDNGGGTTAAAAVVRLRSAAATGPSRGSRPTRDRVGVASGTGSSAGEEEEEEWVIAIAGGDDEPGDHDHDGVPAKTAANKMIVPGGSESDPELQEEHPHHHRRHESPTDVDATPLHQAEGTTTGKTEAKTSKTKTSKRHLCPPPLERQLSTGSSVDSGCSGCAALKELHRENHGLRVRVRGVEALGEVLERARGELEAERRKSSKLETAVANLQSRLHGRGLDTSVDLAEHEIFIPGHDRSFVNRLIQENGRLQKELKEHARNGDAVERISELEKNLDERAKHEQNQRDELRRKDEEITQLLTLVRSSDDARTAKIVHLQDESARLAKELRDLEAACRLLTEEAGRSQCQLDEARARLGAATTEMAVLREKADSLEQRLVAQMAEKELLQMEEAKEKRSNLSVSDRLQLSEGQVEQLSEENKRLTEQLTEVIGMNTRWQRYNQQREVQLARLAKADSAQRSTVTVLERRCGELQQALNDLNALLQAQREEQRRGADAAVLSLEQQLLQREDRVSELAEELSQLKMYLRSSKEGEKTGGGGGRQRQEDKIMIQTLEAQVQIYRDDFNQERKDREHIQGNLEIVKHRLKEAHRQLDHFKSREMSRLRVPTVSKPTEAQTLVARGLPEPRSYPEGATFTFAANNDDDDDLEVDSAVGPASVETDDSRTEPLQCPGCAERFMVAEHSLFMQHVQVCLDH